MGKIELDHTGSGSGIVLSSDGTSLLLGGSAIGGADLFAENYDGSTTKPNAVGTNAVAIGKNAVAGGGSSLAAGALSSSAATLSSAIGFNATVGSSGSYAAAIGQAYANGTDSFAAAIATNSSSYGALGANTIAMGNRAKASDSVSIAIGQDVTSSNGSIAIGLDNTTSGTYSIGIGANADATAAYATALGRNAQATHQGSTAIGYGAATSATNQVALGASGHAVRVSGAYTLPTADGAAGTALVTNGSGALSFAAAGASSINGLSDGYSDASSVGLGTNALLNDDGSANKNTAVGIDSLKTLTSGSLNTVLGWSAGYSATSAASNTAVGYAALYTNTTGGFNVAAGRNALYNNTGSSNVAMGYQAGVDTTSGSYNTFIGHDVRGTATTSQQTALGYQARTAASGSVALSNARAGGSDSFAAIIGDNTSSYGATGTSSIAMGYQSKSTGNYAVAIGKAQATGSDYGVSIGYNARSASHSTVSIGREAGLAGSGSSSISIGHETSSSGYESLAIGRNVVANSSSSVAIGRYARTGGIIGKYAFASDYISNGGDAQQGKYVLHVATTNATATALTSTGTTATSTNQVNLQNNSAYSFHGTIVARQQASGGTACAAWKVEGLIRREGSAGTTVLVNSATTVLDNTPSWGMALSADTTNGGLAITVTGVATTPATNIRWVATIHTSEVTYA